MCGNRRVEVVKVPAPAVRCEGQARRVARSPSPAPVPLSLAKKPPRRPAPVGPARVLRSAPARRWGGRAFYAQAQAAHRPDRRRPVRGWLRLVHDVGLGGAAHLLVTPALRPADHRHRARVHDRPGRSAGARRRSSRCIEVTPPAAPTPPPAPEPPVTIDAQPAPSAHPGHPVGHARRRRAPPSSSKPSPTQRAARGQQDAQRRRQRRQEGSRPSSTAPRRPRATPRARPRTRPSRPPTGRPTPTAAPTAANPTFSLALPGPAPIGVPNFFIDKFRDPALPAADLPGRRHPVRRPLGGPRRDQRDRDRLRAQPQRLHRRRRGLDAVHALDVEAATASTPTTTAARTRTTRSTRSSPPRATSRPPAPTRTSARRSSPTTTPAGTSTPSSCARA